MTDHVQCSSNVYVNGIGPEVRCCLEAGHDDLCQGYSVVEVVPSGVRTKALVRWRRA